MAPGPYAVDEKTVPTKNVEDLPSLDKIKKAIPAECFDKSYAWSTFYLVREFLIFGFLYAIKDYVCATWIGWFLWVNVVGFFGWCLFVVGHDCGHGSFSPSWWYNQICGHIAHTAILVPFNPWQISHHIHHRYHNHLEKDESWKPITKEYFFSAKFYENGIGSWVRKTPLMLCLYFWYLLGVPDSPLLSGSHFWPWSRLFTPEQRLRAGVSIVAVIAWVAFLLATFPLMDLALYFFVPVHITYMWLSLVTYLQHTDPKGKYYDRDNWTYLKGGLTGTIDRDFGWIINHFHHNIETHVLHHLFFTQMPHYHLVTATEAVKPVLGDHYIKDTTPVWKALQKSLDRCEYVDKPAEDAKFYQYVKYDGKKAQ